MEPSPSPEFSKRSSAICPYLRAHRDATTTYAFPAVENRCGAPAGPATLDLDQQARYCLSTEYASCPFYVPAEEFAPQAAEESLQDLSASPSNLPAAEVERTAPFGLSPGLELALVVGVLAGFFVLLYFSRPQPLEGGNSTAETKAALGQATTLAPVLSVTPVNPPAAPLAADAVSTATRIKTSPATVAPATEILTPTPESIQGLAPSASVAPGIPSTPTRIRKPTVTATQPPAATSGNTYPYVAPVPFDPPDGQHVKRNTVLRWSSKHGLGPNEVFEVLTWPQGGTTPTGLGSTTDQVLPIDFKAWAYADKIGTYYWTVRIKGPGGVYLSAPAPPISFTIDAPGSP